MSLTAPKKVQYDIIPNGTHVARLYEIIHIGTIPTNWQGQDKMTDKIRLTFELCNEKKEFKQGEGEKPFSISREFTYSYGSKGHLRPFVEGMTGTKIHDDESPDLEALLGEACLLNVVHNESNGNTYANIQNASPLARGMEAPAIVDAPRVIDINSIPFEELDALPEFIRNKMKSSEEHATRVDESSGEPEVQKEAAPQKLQRPKIFGASTPAEESQPGDIPF
jgi:hypothetical protein